MSNIEGRDEKYNVEWMRLSYNKVGEKNIDFLLL